MIVQKVLKLVALAIDPGAAHEEARSAAYAAVKLIAQHNLLNASDIEEQPSYESPRIRSRQEIKYLAETKTDRYIIFLIKKANLGVFPCLTSKCIADKTLQNCEIVEEEYDLFKYLLQQSLYNKVQKGVLCSKPGCKGGYYLARRYTRHASAR